MVTTSDKQNNILTDTLRKNIFSDFGFKLYILILNYRFQTNRVDPSGDVNIELSFLIFSLSHLCEYLFSTLSSYALFLRQEYQLFQVVLMKVSLYSISSALLFAIKAVCAALHAENTAG